VILRCIICLQLGRSHVVLVAEGFEKQVGQCLQQLLRRHRQRRLWSAAGEIEHELVAGTTSQAPTPDRREIPATGQLERD